MRWWVRVVPVVSSAVVCCAAFTLSFVALSEEAALTGAVPAHLSWLVPLCVDGAVLAASAALWAASMRGLRKDPVAVLTAVALLTVSVVVNVAHAGNSPLAKVIAALPPLTLLASLEIVANAYRSALRADESAAAAAAAELVAEAPAPAVLVAQVAAGVAPHDGVTAGPAKTPAREAPAQASAQGAAGPVEARTPTPAPAAASAPRSAATPAPAAARPPLPALHAAPVAAGEPPVSAVTADPTPPASSVAQSVQDLFAAHVAAGGASSDPTLARVFSTQLQVTPKTVRKHLVPLRLG